MSAPGKPSSVNSPMIFESAPASIPSPTRSGPPTARTLMICPAIFFVSGAMFLIHRENSEICSTIASHIGTIASPITRNSSFRSLNARLVLKPIVFSSSAIPSFSTSISSATVFITSETTSTSCARTFITPRNARTFGTT